MSSGQPTYWRLTAGSRSWVGGAGGEPTADPYGTKWYVETEEGFRDGEEPDVEVERKPNSDGVWEGPVTFPGKLINLTGFFQSPSQSAMYASMEWMRAILAAEPRYGTLVVGDLDETRSKLIKVRRGGPLLLRPFDARQGNFSLSLMAPDPRIRSASANVAWADPPNQSGGAYFPIVFPWSFTTTGASDLVDCYNDGSITTKPDITFYGPCINPRVTHTGTGKFVQVNVQLFDGETLTLDFDTPSVSYMGANRYSALTRDSRWFTLAPGNNRLRFSATAPGANAKMKVTWYDTWR